MRLFTEIIIIIFLNFSFKVSSDSITTELLVIMIKMIDKVDQVNKGD